MKNNKNSFKMNIKDCLSNFPLRLSITDYCNLKCFFCSNEGMDLKQKNKNYMDIEFLERLIEILANAGLKKVSITGGEPLLHPNVEYIIDFLKKFHFQELFFHTNGINLTEGLIKKLVKNFTKVAISIHSVNFNTWQKITGGTRKQFNNLLFNLNLLAIFSKDCVIELKFVPISGYNFYKRGIYRFFGIFL